MAFTQGSQGSKGTLASTCAPKEPIICLPLFVHREDPLDRMRGMVTRYLLPLCRHPILVNGDFTREMYLAKEFSLSYLFVSFLSVSI